jgi:PAS domain S-box-containing protein
LATLEWCLSTGEAPLKLGTIIVELSQHVLEAHRRDEEFVLYRGEHPNQPGSPSVFLLAPVSMQPALETLRKIEYEYSLRDELDSAFAVRSLALSEQRGQMTLELEDPGGETLDRLLAGPMEITRFLRFAAGIATALSGLHEKGLIHKDVKPTNVLVNPATGQARLMGFGIASRLPRERQAPEPPEFIAGTLAYMAPEQTGRMNRSIDSRSDLYALGVTLYEMLTGTLPFTTSDPMELVHAHIARQPTPPCERLKSVPGAVSAIIMKLLAKTAEERYQTAAGAESDFQRCLLEWETQNRIDEFPLGERDTPDRLLIPEKLYGRESEIDALLAAFDRVVAGARPELVLVSGYSGIGKSSVVSELHKRLVSSRGLFASGKFDQYKRDIPYATLAQAFQTLLRPLLTKNEAELSKWRDLLQDALGPNAKLIVNLVPELRLIIGEPPPVPDLPLQDARRRFLFVLRRFIGVFARPEHPLALFLDDLQWLDSATLEVIEDLLTQSDVRHLMLIGAYRDNEVNSSHPLMRKLVAIREAGAPVQEIVLAPLTAENLAELVTESFHCEAERAAPLAELIHNKTAGNPFFAIQFIYALVEEGLLTFDYGHGQWSWKLNRIRARTHTDNVVDLMVGKLKRLPIETQLALQLLACMGNSADLALLEMVSQQSNEETDGRLWEAIRAGLIFRTESSYKFIHDRVQEAAYSLIPEDVRSETHLRIGRLLATSISPEKREDAIFEIVNQLNRGSHLITSAQERKRLAELNLIAGKRAKSSSAYTSALSYVRAASMLLTEENWDEEYDLMFSIEYDTAEFELLTANIEAAEKRLSILAQRAKRRHDVALVTRLRVMIYVILDRSDRAVEISIEYLRGGGTDWSLHPTRDEVVREYDRIWSQLGSREIEELIDLPLMTNQGILDTLDLLNELIYPALYVDTNLTPLIICRMVNLSLEHGNSDSSCIAYLGFAMIAGPHFGNYSKTVSRFGQLAYELVERRGLKRFRPRTYSVFGNIIMPWTRHVRVCRDLIRRAFDALNEIGGHTLAAVIHHYMVDNLLASGDQLAQVQREAENGLAFARKMRHSVVIDIIATQLALIKTLRGMTPKFGCLDDGEMDELCMERHLSSKRLLAAAASRYWIRKMQARYLAGDFAAVLDASLRVQQVLWISYSYPEIVEFYYFGALSHAVSWDSAPPDEKQQHFDTLKAHHNLLDTWAHNCPENFENRAALVAAEIARIEGRDLDAMRLYQQAIHSAHANGFIHNEAIAYEVAARFYAARGFEKIADSYLREARYCYVRWGADGKVRQLDQQYPQLPRERPVTTSMIATPVEHLDLATVIKVSQAVSGEMVLEKLIDRLMRAAIEHAGAERGLLIVPVRNEPLIEAEATMSGQDVTVHRRDGAKAAAALPESVVRYVMRTREIVILDDASSQTPFSADPYIVQCRAHSILCLPLINQTKLIGILYLENNLAPHVFTPDRVTVLKVLASQAANSLENSQLYRDLEDREGKIRRLVDANILGIFIWNLEGLIVEANDAFLRMLQYGRDDLASGRVRWTDLTPAEWRDRDQRAMAELKATGTFQPYEKEFLPKDGSPIPVLAGGALFQEGGNEGVAFVLDLSEQKRAEEKIREQEVELRQMLDLAPQHVAVLVHGKERIFANQALLNYFGLRLEEWQSRGTQTRVHPDDWDRLMLESQAPPDQFEARFLRYDGRYRWFLVRNNPLYDEQGQITRWYVAGTDIEDRKQAEERLRQENVALREEIDKASMFEEIVGTSSALKAVLSRIAKVGPTDSTVLITGETGTGKELIARAVHKRSQRSGRPFVSVNCAALPPTLVSSELFGHEKGAFTGATQRRIGRFEMADRGTIFLDEVGELLPDTQAALLRVLQEREFERVGGGQPIQVDVRVIAATNRDLNAAVANGTFRQDLLYRLNVFPIEMPPLRERKDDILMLVEYFAQRYANRAGKNMRSIDKKTLDLLRSYDWPGNIRELQNVIERSIILSSADVFSVDELWLSKRTPQASRVETPPALKVETRSEREIIEAVLAETRGRVSGPSGAAAKLRIPPSTLETRIKALRINKQQFKFG